MHLPHDRLHYLELWNEVSQVCSRGRRERSPSWPSQICYNVSESWQIVPAFTQAQFLHRPDDISEICSAGPLILQRICKSILHFRDSWELKKTTHDLYSHELKKFWRYLHWAVKGDQFFFCEYFGSYRTPGQQMYKSEIMQNNHLFCIQHRTAKDQWDAPLVVLVEPFLSVLFLGLPHQW